MIQNLSAAIFDRDDLNFRRHVKNYFASESKDIFHFVLTIAVVEFSTQLSCRFPRLATRKVKNCCLCIACSLVFRPSLKFFFFVAVVANVEIATSVTGAPSSWSKISKTLALAEKTH